MGQGTGKSGSSVYGNVVALNVRRNGKLERTYDTNSAGQTFNTTGRFVNGIDSGPRQYSATPGTLKEIGKNLEQQGYTVTYYTAESLSKKRKKERRDIGFGS